MHISFRQSPYCTAAIIDRLPSHKMTINSFANDTLHRQVEGKRKVDQIFTQAYQLFVVHHFKKLICLPQAVVGLVTKCDFTVAEIGLVGFS